jgi:hypothetical protein
LNQAPYWPESALGLFAEAFPSSVLSLGVSRFRASSPQPSAFSSPASVVELASFSFLWAEPFGVPDSVEIFDLTDLIFGRTVIELPLSARHRNRVGFGRASARVTYQCGFFNVSNLTALPVDGKK